MKPILLVIVFVLLLSSYRSVAQLPVVSKVLPTFTFGVKIGADFQQIDGNLWKNTYGSGPVGGAFVALTKKRVGVQAEVLASSAKIYYNFPEGYSPGPLMLPAYAKMVYLNVPVLFEYKLISHLWLQAGPQFNELTSAKNNEGFDIRNSFNTAELGGVLGLQATLPLHLTASARYMLGLTDDGKLQGYQEWHSHSIQLAVGYKFL